MEFDHTYITVDSFAPFEALQSRGFSLASKEVRHPHSVTCRFIHFDAPSGASRPFQYLEFVNVGDLNALRDAENSERAAAGLQIKLDTELLVPGFSLVSTELKTRYSALCSDSELVKFKPSLVHRNYNWETTDDPDAPGWNYLRFGNRILNFFEIWVTEYEHDPGDPNRYTQKIEAHKNTCYGVKGCIWDLSPEDLGPFKRLTNSKSSDSKVILEDGFTIWHGEAAVAPLVKFTKSNKFKAIVLKCQSLDVLKKETQPDAVIQWNGSEAAVLNPYNDGWLMIIVEE